MSRPVVPCGLYCADNLSILRDRFPDECIDLIYLDPPFNTRCERRVGDGGWGMGDREESVSPVYSDTWRWGNGAQAAYDEQISVGRNPELSRILQAMRGFLDESDLMAYLVMMAPRVMELHRVLRPTGSLYLHCDPTASHYLKFLLDAIFGPKNFQNEIIWAYKSGGATSRRWARKHDVILFYSKNPRLFLFHPQKEKSYNRGLKPYRFQGVTEYEDENGWHTLVNMKDVWQIDMVGRTSSERVGYPTQKPLALLERIVAASSNEGDLVLDPFCGSGTTLVAAQNLGRRWVGIDSSEAAIVVAKGRLHR